MKNQLYFKRLLLMTYFRKQMSYSQNLFRSAKKIEKYTWSRPEAKIICKLAVTQQEELIFPRPGGGIVCCLFVVLSVVKITKNCAMPMRCVVQNCSCTRADGVSLHKFPKNKVLSRLWTKFVLTHRKNFSPSDHSCVCSRHFTSSDFVDNSVKTSLGFSPK